MIEVIKNLYIGGDKDYERIKNNKGWSIVRCCKEGPGGHRDTLGYTTLGAPKDKNYLWVLKGNRLVLNMLDLDKEYSISDTDPKIRTSLDFIDKMVSIALDFIDKKLQSGDKVLVSCNKGISRSPTTAFLYMKKAGEFPTYKFSQARRVFKALYPPYDPNLVMNKYVKEKYVQLERS